MRLIKLIKTILVVESFGLVLVPLCSNAVTLTNLVSFSKTNGNHPYALLQAADGNFYGTTAFGGVWNYGTVFKMTPAGALSTLLSFNTTNGAYPYTGLVQGSNGLLYGTTSGASGGANSYGTVFVISTNGAFTNLASFNYTNGCCPEYGALTPGADGNFYGTTQYGGTNGGSSGGYGTVFKITPVGVLTSLFSFNSSNGANPCGSLVHGANGSLYGTTSAGGAWNSGTVFLVTTNGAFTNLVSFNTTNGATPYAGLTMGSDGNLYGTTSAGGAWNSGTIFKMTPAGALTTLVSFDVIHGSTPYAGLLLGSDGNFYGTTEQGGANTDGTVFQFSPGGVLTTLVSLEYFTSGDLPVAGLLQAADGTLYGATVNGGGGAGNGGTIFRLVGHLPPVFRTARWTGSNLTFSWSAVAGLTYQVEFKTNMTQTGWSSLGGASLATNSTLTATDTPGADAHRFYRVNVLP